MQIPRKWINKVLPEKVLADDFLTRTEMIKLACNNYGTVEYRNELGKAKAISPTNLAKLIDEDLVKEMERLKKDKGIEYYIYKVFYDVGFLALKVDALSLHLSTGDINRSDGIYIEYVGTHTAQEYAGFNLQEFTVNRSEELGKRGIVYLCSVSTAKGFYELMGYETIGISRENPNETYMRLDPNGCQKKWSKFNGTWEYGERPNFQISKL